MRKVAVVIIMFSLGRRECLQFFLLRSIFSEGEKNISIHHYDVEERVRLLSLRWESDGCGIVERR